MKSQKEIKTLPYPFYFWTVAALALASLANAVYLAISHYRVYTDMGYRSFCAVSKAINCDTVSQSPFSVFLNVPVPVWGIVGYLFFLVLLIPARVAVAGKSRYWPTLFGIALVFSVYSIVLALITSVYIHSYCIMCIVSYAGNFALLYFTWLICRRFGHMSLGTGLKNDFLFFVDNKVRSIVFLATVVMTFVILLAFFPAYWKISSHAFDKVFPTGITAEGHPWIGAEDPQLTITEFTDYQCFQCKKMHFYLRELIASYPDTIRLVHRNFPIDHTYNPLVKDPFHVGSGKMALFSLYAAEAGKFWELSDMLFEVDIQKGNFNLRGMAKAAGFDVVKLAQAVNDKKLQYKLLVDIREAMKLGVSGTPAYLIDEAVYVGHVPEDVFNEVMGQGDAK